MCALARRWLCCRRLLRTVPTALTRAALRDHGSQHTESVAYNPLTGNIFAQPQTRRLDLSDAGVSGSELFVFDTSGGQPIDVIALADLQFWAGGMLARENQLFLGELGSDAARVVRVVRGARSGTGRHSEADHRDLLLVETPRLSRGTQNSCRRAWRLLHRRFMTTRETLLRILSSCIVLAACSGSEGGVTASDGTRAGDDPSSDVDQRFATLTRDYEPSDSASEGDGESYLRLERDVRRCAAPLCGGFFVQRVNRLTTRCADGSRAESCYVAELDFAALELSAEQIASVEGEPASVIVRGDLTAFETDVGELGRLNVSEVWQGHAGVEPRGAFVRAENAGIVCITSPCLSFSAELLNSRLPAVAVAEVDVSGVTGDPSDALQQLNASDGLLVAASPVLVSGPAGRALGLETSEYYLPVTAEAQVCGTRGVGPCLDGSFCDFPAGANCGRADAPGVCAPTPELCIEIFAPVCGCDGQTYDNACFANAAGVSVETEGPCE